MENHIILVHKTDDRGNGEGLIGAFKSMEDAKFWIDTEKVKQEDAYDPHIDTYTPYVGKGSYFTTKVKLFYT